MKCVLYGPVSGDIPSFVGVVFSLFFLLSKVMKFFPKKKSNQRHNFRHHQGNSWVKREHARRWVFGGVQRSNGFFFQNCWWIAHPEKLRNVPWKIVLGKRWFFLSSFFKGTFVHVLGGVRSPLLLRWWFQGLHTDGWICFMFTYGNLGNDDDDDDDDDDDLIERQPARRGFSYTFGFLGEGFVTVKPQPLDVEKTAKWNKTRDNKLYTWNVKKPVNNAINYQPHLVSQISSISSMAEICRPSCRTQRIGYLDGNYTPTTTPVWWEDHPGEK